MAPQEEEETTPSLESELKIWWEVTADRVVHCGALHPGQLTDSGAVLGFKALRQSLVDERWRGGSTCLRLPLQFNRLDLGQNRLGDRAMRALVSALVAGNTFVTDLRLHKNRIGVAGARALASLFEHLKGTPPLALHLSHNYIPPYGAKLLITAAAESRRLPSSGLRPLWLRLERQRIEWPGFAPGETEQNMRAVGKMVQWMNDHISDCRRKAGLVVPEDAEEGPNVCLALPKSHCTPWRCAKARWCEERLAYDCPVVHLPYLWCQGFSTVRGPLPVPEEANLCAWDAGWATWTAEAPAPLPPPEQRCPVQHPRPSNWEDIRPAQRAASVCSMDFRETFRPVPGVPISSHPRPRSVPPAAAAPQAARVPKPSALTASAAPTQGEACQVPATPASVLSSEGDRGPQMMSQQIQDTALETQPRARSTSGTLPAVPAASAGPLPPRSGPLPPHVVGRPFISRSTIDDDGKSAPPAAEVLIGLYGDSLKLQDEIKPVEAGPTLTVSVARSSLGAHEVAPSDAAVASLVVEPVVGPVVEPATAPIQRPAPVAAKPKQPPVMLRCIPPVVRAPKDEAAPPAVPSSDKMPTSCVSPAVPSGEAKVKRHNKMPHKTQPGALT